MEGVTINIFDCVAIEKPTSKKRNKTDGVTAKVLQVYLNYYSEILFTQAMLHFFFQKKTSNSHSRYQSKILLSTLGQLLKI